MTFALSLLGCVATWVSCEVDELALGSKVLVGMHSEAMLLGSLVAGGWQPSGQGSGLCSLESFAAFLQETAPFEKLIF